MWAGRPFFIDDRGQPRVARHRPRTVRPTRQARRADRGRPRSPPAAPATRSSNPAGESSGAAGAAGTARPIATRTTLGHPVVTSVPGPDPDGLDPGQRRAAGRSTRQRGEQRHAGRGGEFARTPRAVRPPQAAGAPSSKGAPTRSCSTRDREQQAVRGRRSSPSRDSTSAAGQPFRRRGRPGRRRRRPRRRWSPRTPPRGSGPRRRRCRGRAPRPGPARRTWPRPWPGPGRAGPRRRAGRGSSPRSRCGWSSARTSTTTWRLAGPSGTTSATLDPDGVAGMTAATTSRTTVRRRARVEEGGKQHVAGDTGLGVDPRHAAAGGGAGIRVLRRSDQRAIGPVGHGPSGRRESARGLRRPLVGQHATRLAFRCRRGVRRSKLVDASDSAWRAIRPASDALPRTIGRSTEGAVPRASGGSPPRRCRSACGTLGYGLGDARQQCARS